MIYAITDGRVHLLPEAKITWPRWRHRPIGLARKSQQLFAGIIPMNYLVPWPASHRERSGCLQHCAGRTNATCPLDTKQYRKIIIRCCKLVDRNPVRLRRHCRKEGQSVAMAQRFRRNPRRRKQREKAIRDCAPSLESFDARLGAKAARCHNRRTTREL